MEISFPPLDLTQSRSACLLPLYVPYRAYLQTILRLPECERLRFTLCRLPLLAPLAESKLREVCVRVYEC